MDAIATQIFIKVGDELKAGSELSIWKHPDSVQIIAE
jgi:hypothetical protein